MSQPLKKTLLCIKHSISNLSKQLTIWLMLFAGVVVVLFATIFLPLISFTNHSIADFYDSEDWIPVICPLLFIVIAGLSSFVADQNTQNGEAVFILTKTIKRWQYLISKTVSTLLFIFSFIIFVILIFVITNSIMSKTHFSIYHKKYINEIGFYFSLLAFGMFGVVCGTFLHSKLTSTALIIIVLLAVTVYALGYINIQTISNKTPWHSLWYSSIFPNLIFYPLSVILVGAGIKIFQNTKVEA